MTWSLQSARAGARADTREGVGEAGLCVGRGGAARCVELLHRAQNGRRMRDGVGTARGVSSVPWFDVTSSGWPALR